MISILILSVEGNESNTEINFYNGFMYYINNSKFFGAASAIGKIGDGKDKEDRVKGKIRQLFNKYSNELLDSDVFVFFVGDGDDEGHIKSMNRSIKAASDELGNLLELMKGLNIYKELIYDKEKSIEEILLSINGIVTIKNQKVGSNKDLFNQIAKQANWVKGEKVDLVKIISDFESVGSSHMLIFKTIQDLIKK